MNGMLYNCKCPDKCPDNPLTTTRELALNDRQPPNDEDVVRTTRSVLVEFLFNDSIQPDDDRTLQLVQNDDYKILPFLINIVNVSLHFSD